ncbi:MAG: glutamine--tRNA ligase/YqeY domain fusion protein [Rhodothermales bacterium]
MDNSSSVKDDVSRTSGPNFLRAIIDKNLKEGLNGDAVVTRFPPEPNGYMHIGHASSVCLNFGIARDYPGGIAHLRFDDTNPDTEEIEYVESIKRDVRWLGFDFKDKLFFASDYFEKLYDFAINLIEQGKAYIDSESEEEIRAHRGTVTEAGVASRYRNRSVEENLDLFKRMRAGEFENGAHVLRAKIDMASNNMLLRDPVLYRIKHAHHYRKGSEWCIYPLYDFAHPLSDAIEGITHSICTLEFEVHRPLYDWLVDNVQVDWNPRPRQHEFARRNLDYTIVSKRKLLRLVNEGFVDGWDDPRMPTVSALRRRGYTPESIQAFCDLIGIGKAENRVDIALLEYSIRNDLNHKARRVMGVLRPLKVIITNYPEGKTEKLEASYWPHDVPKEGTREVPFSREIFVERDDFKESPSKKFFRLAPGQEVRLRYAYVIKCEDVIKDEAGEVVALHCTYDPESMEGGANADKKVKGTIHWVSAAHAVPAEVRLYDRLFSVADPEKFEEGGSFLDNLNPDSKEVLTTCVVEPSLVGTESMIHFQFERQGYFITDEKDSRPDKLVFNRVVTLRDSWAKVSKQATPGNGSSKKAKEGNKDFVARTREDIIETLTGTSSEAVSAFERFVDEMSLSITEAEVLATDTLSAKLVEDSIEAGATAKASAAWVVNVLPGELKERSLETLAFDGKDLAALIGFIDDGTISTRIAKEVLAEMIASGNAPADIIEEKGLKQVSDSGALGAIVDELIGKFPDKVDQYRSGKTGLMGFFVGQAMKATQGKANPQMLKELLDEKLA